MFRRLLDLVACPECGSRLTAHAIRETPLTASPPQCRTWCATERREVANGASLHPCTGCYSPEIDEGFLECDGCAKPYPVIEGVPRLISNAPTEYPSFYEKHQHFLGSLGLRPSTSATGSDPGKFHRRSNESFSFQWQVYQYTDRTWFKDDLDLRRREFLASIDVDEASLAGAVVLDAGCGNGRLTASIAGYGAEVVGMDLSGSVERAHANRHTVAGDRAPFVHFVQGNLMEPPLRPGAFDYVHTSGVLHHTPDTRRAFLSVLRLARSGARVYVQLYRTRPAWVGIPNRMIRAITTRLPVPLLFRMCYAAAPVHAFLVAFVSSLRGESTPLTHATRRENAVSMFDNYSPRYQYRYRPEQVASMFTAAGLKNVKDVTLPNEMRHMVAFVGDK